MDRLMKEETKSRNPYKYLKSMGIGAFLFFFIKGLIWLAVFFGLFKFVGC